MLPIQLLLILLFALVAPEQAVTAKVDPIFYEQNLTKILSSEDLQTKVQASLDVCKWTSLIHEYLLPPPLVDPPERRREREACQRALYTGNMIQRQKQISQLQKPLRP